MPSTSKTIEEIKKTNKNIKDQNSVYDAFVLANYGDPGLDEDYFADIHSRYLICILDSPLRLFSYDRWYVKMTVLVKRPEQLWIDYEGDFLNSPSSQKRKDYSYNINSGPAGSYVVDNIPRINYPYEIGEKIKIKNTSPQDIFYSKTPVELFESNLLYKTWHKKGADKLNFYTLDNPIENYLNTRTIYPIEKINDSLSNYGVFFNKYQYEAMILNLLNNSFLRNFFKGLNTEAFFNNAHGGYFFRREAATPAISFKKLIYEDVNVGGKARIASNSCLPLVVTSPNSFATPKVREGGVINYNPTYIPYTN
jgi:hypothetical protein